MRGRRKTPLTLTIGGRSHTIPTLEVGQTLTFDGYANVKSSAIERKSKNNYDVSCITSFNAVHKPVSSLEKAVDVLQGFYARYGTAAVSDK